jgi:hypothetical protein
MSAPVIVAEIDLSNGETYTVTREGWIGRPSAGVVPSPSWYITGARAYNNFGNTRQIYRLEAVLGGRVTWRYRNGKPRAFLQDVDHGTKREQRAPSVVRVRVIDHA